VELRLVEAQIEAILFTMGEAVELDRLALAIDHDEDTARKIIQNMMDKHDDESRGIHIIDLDGAYQLCTKASMYESIIKITHIPKKHILTEVLLETLSIIAYKQPVSRLQVEAIRGVKSDYPINKLIEYNLICELGRMDAPGRPILFGTTEEFLRSFGLQSLDSLPAINPEKLEDFKLEAEEEAEQFKLDI
jgi:segregation and condensation protein B